MIAFSTTIGNLKNLFFFHETSFIGLLLTGYVFFNEKNSMKEFLLVPKQNLEFSNLINDKSINIAYQKHSQCLQKTLNMFAHIQESCPKNKNNAP